MAAQIEPSALLASLSKAALLPSPVIPEAFKPSVELSVSFNEKPVVAGNLFRVSEVKDAPSVSFTPEVRTSQVGSNPFTSSDPYLFPSPRFLQRYYALHMTNPPSKSHLPPTTSYTLLLIDPDAPTPSDPKFAYWRHWVVTRIPSASPFPHSGTTLTQYLAPGPKDDSEPHRYLFLLYREPGDLKDLSKEDVGGEEFVERRSFGAEEWVRKWGLELVGVNWMLGAGDGWVGGGKDEL